MTIFEIFIVSATVFFTAALLMIVVLAIFMLLMKIAEIFKKRTMRAEQNQGFVKLSQKKIAQANLESVLNLFRGDAPNWTYDFRRDSQNWSMTL